MNGESWRVVLFDFDGVLCDSLSSAIDVAEDLRSGPPFDQLPSPAHVGHFGVLYRGVLRDALLRFGLDSVESRAFFDGHARSMKGLSSQLDLFEGVAEGLSELDPEQYAIITSSYSSTVVEAFQRSGLTLDPAVVIGHEIRETKTTKILSALADRGVDPTDAVYVGDMESDVLYCRDVPIRCIGVTYGYHPEEVLVEASPFLIERTPASLFKTLKEGITA